LPDRDLEWRDVGVGAVITAFLFTIGKSLIGWYLGRSTIASSYGAAGAMIIVLLWVYYSSEIFLFGAEITRAYSRRRSGGRDVPTANSATVAAPAMPPTVQSSPLASSAMLTAVAVAMVVLALVRERRWWRSLGG
jgi:membrane protein